VHACVEDQQGSNKGKLKGVMLTVGDRRNPKNNFNLNVFGLMSGKCDTFVVERSSEISDLRIAYTTQAVTAIQVGTFSKRYAFFGLLGPDANQIDYAFTRDQPWIGFTGYSTTHPTALAPVSAYATCQPTLTVFEKH
jgi:hypothetical protein